MKPGKAHRSAGEGLPSFQDTRNHGWEDGLGISVSDDPTGTVANREVMRSFGRPSRCRIREAKAITSATCARVESLPAQGQPVCSKPTESLPPRSSCCPQPPSQTKPTILTVLASCGRRWRPGMQVIWTPRVCWVAPPWMVGYLFSSI